VTTVVRPGAAKAWELRGAWANRKRVALSLSERCVISRLEGLVDRVAVTGAFVVIDGWHVPTEEILAIHKPTRRS
jgi:hypothetical protein